MSCKKKHVYILFTTICVFFSVKIIGKFSQYVYVVGVQRWIRKNGIILYELGIFECQKYIILHYKAFNVKENIVNKIILVAASCMVYAVSYWNWVGIR